MLRCDGGFRAVLPPIYEVSAHTQFDQSGSKLAPVEEEKRAEVPGNSSIGLNCSSRPTRTVTRRIFRAGPEEVGES